MPQTLSGSLTRADFTLPEWTQNHLHMALWERAEGPEHTFLHAALTGHHGTFDAPLSSEAASRLAAAARPDGPQIAVSIGWGERLDPVLVALPLPNSTPAALNWDGTVTLIGYVEQLHLEEAGGIALAILELVGHAVPLTYRRLPPLPLPALGDRHSLHADRPLEDSPEQVTYVLADAETPFAALAQDALVSSLRVVVTASLGEQAAGWHEMVNIPLVLDKITLIGP